MKGRTMGSWTLRGFTPRFDYKGEQQDHPAALRAQRYVRRHGWQFHGAGVKDAVQRLTLADLVLARQDSQKAQEAVKQAMAAFGESLKGIVSQGRAGLELSGPVEETAHGLTVVGWKDGAPHLVFFYCLECRPAGSSPVTAADVTASTECQDCGTRLLGPAIPPAECPDCKHAHVEGQHCTAPTAGPFPCGCTG